MNKQEELNKKLFNRLFLKMPTVRKLKEPIDKVGTTKLEKSIRYLYYSKNDEMWFGHSETKTKFLYFFGLHNDHITNLNDIENSFSIDFDKNATLNNYTLGLINDQDMTLYLNKELLEEKYPNFNFTKFKEHNIQYFEKSVKLEIQTLELGKIYGDFILNLKKLINELPVKTKKSKARNETNPNERQMNLFLNAIKAGKTYEQSLKIANLDSSKVKYWYNYGLKGNEEYIEFYETYKEIMPRDNDEYEKMKIIIDSLNSGKSEETAIDISGSKAEEVEKWYKSGQRGELEYIEFYEDLKKFRDKTKRENKNKTKQKNADLIKEYIKLINDGKTNKEAFETLEIPRFKTKNWKQQGQLGNKDYQEFYETYQKAVQREKIQKEEKSKKEDQELIKKYIKLVNDGKTNKEAFETLEIPRFKTKNWKQQGQLGNKDYQEFYETYQKAVKNEEIRKANQFIELINEGKTNEQALNIIKMPDFKIKQWFNSGKNGDEDFVGFYDAYMKQYDTGEKEVTKDVPKYNPKPVAKEEEIKSGKTCEICGRSINAKSTSTICKRCKRKQRGANILQKLLLSIEPEIPFKKDDLKRLGLEGIQLQDTIWILQENSLIQKEKNNKISLVNKDILDEFIDEWAVEKIEEETVDVKLTKKCSTCGKTLEISKFPVSESSPDGYEDNCKDCKKFITTASYLKELLTNFNYDQEFSEDELAKFIPESFLRQAKTFSLIENDLLTKNLDTNNYKITNKEKCEEFLDKYFKEIIKPKIQEEPQNQTIEPPETPELSDKEKQIEIVLNERREGKTRKESANIAGISLYKITHWYKEGRDGFGEDNIHFYKELKKIEDKLIKELKRKFNTTLKVLKKGGSIEEALDKASVTPEELDSWIKKGENGIKPYDSFLKQYKKYVKKSTDYNAENNIKARKKFLKYIREGSTRKDAAKKASIELKLLDSWILKGTKGEKPYNEFYNEYRQARDDLKVKPGSQEGEIKKEFIELLEKGYTLGEASKQIKNGKYAIDIKKWYVAGKKGVNKHLKFYLSCQQAKNKFKENKNKIFTLIADGFTIKESCEKLNLNPVKIKKDILKGHNGEKPHDEFFKKLIESKTSLIDIKQLFKSEEHPHKNQMVDVLDLMLIGKSESEALNSANVSETTLKYWINRGKQNFGELYSEFYEIYSQMKSGELINRLKKEIENQINRELDEIEDLNADILAPLPKKIKKNLDAISKETHTGFAWVNKIENLWTYSKRIDGRNIKITDIDIYELHKKVIKNNLMWGVRDLNKAKETLKLSGSKKNIENDLKNNSESNSDILAPLSKDIKTKFSKGTSTGFAWVSKSGDNFYYTRANMNIRIKSSTIKELYDEVISKNLDWGVINLSKAKKTLKIKNETIDKNFKKPPTIENEILTPLPDDLEKELSKFSRGTSTGFAWVSKTGKKYSYTKVVNNREVTFRETTIENLYKKVISQKLPWGVRDLEKAKLTLNEKNEEETPQKTIIKTILTKDIYAPFPKEYENLLKSNPTNKSGIPWVNKTGNKWKYSRTDDGKIIEITDNNIFKLYKKVIEQNQIWGIREYEKAKISLLTEPTDDTDYILKPISQESDNQYPNDTGFAFVNKIGDNWEYIKTYKGNKISASSIFGLYEKILDKNLIWGVVDYTKVKKSLGIKNLPKKETKQEKTKNISTDPKNIEKEKISKNILAPLPEHLKNEFKQESKDPTGFAWVRKYGSNWYYIRKVNNEQITIKDKDLRILHQKVIHKNLHWGVRDFEKAKRTLYNKPLKPNNNEKPSKQKENNENKTINEIKSRIPKTEKNNKLLTLLPSNIKYENKKDFLDNTTGFAWVEKIDGDWIYKRKVNGIEIKLKYNDIYKLYEVISNNNYDWGVIDLNKAVLTLCEHLGLINDDELFKNQNINTDSTSNILNPLSKKHYSKHNIIDNESGIAWVDKKKDTWQYSRIINDTELTINDSNIYRLHEKVIDHDLDWGIIDLEKAKETLISKPLDNPKKYFLSPISPKLKRFVRTDTGFALVFKIDNQWEYRIHNTKDIIQDENLFGLYEKVFKKELLWGITDINKAKKAIEISIKPQKTNENSTETESQSSSNFKIKDDILTPLPKEVEMELKKLSSGTSTGFAWVIKTGKNYSYKKRVHNEIISITDPNIYELHKKVIEQGFLWGVRDIYKAKKTLKKSNRKKSNAPKEVVNNNILAELPEEHELLFKTKSNKSGIAWVSRIGDYWVYSRTLNNKFINIRDKDIYQLHKKVTNEKLTWGIRDIEKAKKIIKVNEPQKIKETKHNENILKPIPIEIEQKLRKNSKNNTSGFAWVSKIGNKWQYTRVINGIPITLRDSDIYKLHEIVIKNNHEWGVRDLTKAKQTLRDSNKELPKPPKVEKIPKKTVQKSFSTSKKDNTDDEDILTPLPEKYENIIKPSSEDTTGIAWVDKIDNQWIYSRTIGGSYTAIKDENIYNLHKKVLNQGLTWGITDYTKARAILFNAQPTEKIKPTVFVTTKGNIVAIEGKIKNNEVLKVLTKIYEYGDSILKMNTEKSDEETSLSIQLDLDKQQRIEFKEKIKDFGWEID